MRGVFGDGNFGAGAAVTIRQIDYAIAAALVLVLAGVIAGVFA